MGSPRTISGFLKTRDGDLNQPSWYWLWPSQGRRWGQRTRHLGDLWGAEPSCISFPPQTSEVWRMSLLTQEYSACERFPDGTGDHYYNFGICNPFISFLYMVFAIKVLEKVKVNKNMQKYWGLNISSFFFSSFIVLFSVYYYLGKSLTTHSLRPQCPHKIRHKISPLPSYQHSVAANRHLVTVASITSRQFQVCLLWCATEAEDPVTLLVKYIHFQGLELNLHVFTLDWNLPLILLYNWQGEWQESTTERSCYMIYGNYPAYCQLDSSS